VKFLQDCFAELNFKGVKEFASAQECDSTALNPSIARTLKIQHTACCAHCVNLACAELEDKDKTLEKLVDATQDCHHAIRNSNKLCASLANVRGFFCKLRLKATTHWLSVHGLFSSHLKAAGGICEVADSDTRNEAKNGVLL
jgi:hypothetical protein